MYKQIDACDVSIQRSAHSEQNKKKCSISAA